MKAAVIREHGDYDLIHVEEMPDPTPKPGEVVIRVHAAGVNHLDVWMLKGRPGLDLDMPHILGSDCAGVVAAVGDGVTNAREGDEVLINPALPCHGCDACRRGEESECDTFGIVGLTTQGTFAEKVALPANRLAPKPEHLNWKEAGALPLAHLTAYRMVVTRAAIQPGETVLIHGVGGGVAMAALQFAKHIGARVIGTTSTGLKARFAKTLGADEVVRYDEVDVAEAVMDLTNGRGVDAVVDVVGAKTWGTNLTVLRRGGRLAICGVTTGPEAPTSLRDIYWKQLTVLGSTLGSDADFRATLDTVNAARIAPVIGAVEPLPRAHQAVNRLLLNLQIGKTVVYVSR